MGSNVEELPVNPHPGSTYRYTVRKIKVGIGMCYSVPKVLKCLVPLDINEIACPARAAGNFSCL
jgi:hypothetical protein